MKRLMMMFLLVASSLLVLLMFVGEDEEFHLLARKQSYSIYQSYGQEAIRFQFFVSDEEAYYVKQDHLVHVSIQSQNKEEQVSLEIKKLHLGEDVWFAGEEYFELRLDASLQVHLERYEIVYEEAYLVLLYENKERIDIELGEFSYLVGDYNDGLRVSEMVATHVEDDGVKVSGLYVDLSHTYEEDIVIASVELGTSAAKVNNFYVRELVDRVSYKDRLEDILLVDSYALFGEALGDLSIALKVRESKGLYFPFVYQKEDVSLQRFYIKVHYLVGGRECMDVIDDFPFIRQQVEAFGREDYDAYYPRMQREEF